MFVSVTERVLIELNVLGLLKLFSQVNSVLHFHNSRHDFEIIIQVSSVT